MKNICFIGAFDKLDLILYLSKILKNMGNKILVIDATQLQKARYIVPTITPAKSYITRFEDVDIAIGFDSYDDIEKYIGYTEEHQIKYDYALVNVDDGKKFEQFNNEETLKNYFVTSFDLYSLKKGMEILSGMGNKQRFKKIIFSNNPGPEEDEYLNFLSSNYNIEWDSDIINFPVTLVDEDAIMENQRESKIKFKNLTQSYRECIIYITSQILGYSTTFALRKRIKNIDKGA